MKLLNAALILLLLASCNGQSTKKTPVSDTTTRESSIPGQSDSISSKIITVGKNKIKVSFRTKIDDGHGHPESNVAIEADGKEVLQKKYTAMFSFLEPNSFQVTNPVPKDKSVLLAVGGEYVETGSFLFLQQEGDKVIVKELQTGAADNTKNTLVILKEIKTEK